MNKILWTTDIHLKFSNLDITEKLFQFLLKTIDEKKPDSLFITGDVNDSKSIIRSECLTQIRSFLKKVDIPVYILVGNHDLHNTRKPELGHSLESLNDFEHVHIVDKPLLLDDIKLIPYIDDPNLLRKELKKDAVSYVFCHNGIQGAQMNTKGTYDDFSLSDGQFKGFKQVFVGHYHNYCQFKNITYLGSPFSHSFNESNVDKYVGLIDLKKNKVDLLKTHLRQHMDFHIMSEEENDFDAQIQFMPGDLVRITIEGNKEANLKVLEQLKNVEAKFIVKNTDRMKKRISIDPNASKKDVLNKYVSKVKTDLDKKKIKQIGEELIASL